MFFKKKKPHLERTHKLVMAFGTFDLLHAGHENFFAQARKLGDEILVVLARDETVKSVKGEAPENNENQRLKNLRKAGWADKIILGNFGDKHKVILKYRPNIIALGYDQFVFTQTIEKTLIDANINTEVVRLEPYQPEVNKSSLLKAKAPLND
jgi:FAD synthetase